MLGTQRQPVRTQAHRRWHSLYKNQLLIHSTHYSNANQPVQHAHRLRCLIVQASAASGGQAKKQYARRSRGKFDTPAEQIDKELFPDIDPSDPFDFVDLDAGYASSKAEVRRLRTQRLQELYGEHVTDGDVRLYLSKRERNRQRPSKRGDFPADDSFDRPQTFLKLAAAFREVVLAERAEALTTMMAISHEQALQLYRLLPGMLCYTSLEVAYRVKGLCRALHMGSEALLPLLARDPRLAFLDPEVVEARCGQVAKLCGMRLPVAAHLLAANGDVLLARNNRLLRRVEELAVSFRCSTAAALHVLCGYPPTATLERAVLQQRLLAAARLLGILPADDLEPSAAGELIHSTGAQAGPAAGGPGPGPGARAAHDSGPVRPLFPGLSGQQAEQLWGLLAGCPGLASLDPEEVQGQLGALGAALHLGQQEVQAACRQQPWLLAADAAAVASRLQLLLRGLPEVAAAGRAGGRALVGSTAAKKVKLMAMLEVGAAGAGDTGSSTASGGTAAPATAEGITGGVDPAAMAAGQPAGSVLAPTEVSRLLPALRALSSCQGLLAVELQELQQTLQRLVAAAAAVARRPMGAAHQYVIEAVMKQPQLLLLQLQQEPVPQLVLRSVPAKAVEFCDSSAAGAEQHNKGMPAGDGDDGAAWQQALRAAWKGTNLPLRALLQELHQLHLHVSDAP